MRHHGQEVAFDWSVRSASTIQWAAFYSGCEHEIDTFTEGIGSRSLTTCTLRSPKEP